MTTTIFNNLQDALRGSDAMNEELYKHLMANKEEFKYKGDDYAPLHDCLVIDGEYREVMCRHDGFDLTHQFTSWNTHDNNTWFKFDGHGIVFYYSMDNWVHTDNGDGTFHVKRMRTHRISVACREASCADPQADEDFYDDVEWHAFEWVECVAEGDAPVNAMEYIGAFYSPAQDIRFMPNFIVAGVAEYAMDAINYWHSLSNEEMVKRVLEACRVAVQVRKYDEPRKTCLLSVEQLAKLARDYEEFPDVLPLVEAMRNDVEEFDAKHAELVSYAAGCRKRTDELMTEAAQHSPDEYRAIVCRATASECREEADEAERRAGLMKRYVRVLVEVVKVEANSQGLAKEKAEDDATAASIKEKSARLAARLGR